LVVAPSRELAAQIHREFQRLCKGRKWSVHLLTPANANANSLGSKEKLGIFAIISVSSTVAHVFSPSLAFPQLSLMQP
jgi:hypothetical protein